MMDGYKVGEVVENFRFHEECVQFDILDDGAVMLVFFQEPTQKEISQFKSDKNFEIRFTELYGIIMVTAKIGNLDWMDAPYTPHLSKNLTKFQIPNKGQGLGLTLILIDAISGRVEHIRSIGLSESFTRKLFAYAMEEKMNSFDRQEFDHNLQRIYSSYTTEQIVNLSKDYCRVGD